jgi:hypothetical protein
LRLFLYKRAKHRNCLVFFYYIIMVNRKPNCFCKSCEKPIYRSPCKLQAGSIPTCSTDCRNNYLDIKYPERIQKCYICKKTYRTNPAYIRKTPNYTRYCSYKCMWKNLSENSKGSVDSLGYRVISVNGKRYREHRYLMEQELNRKLETKEHVHHVDGNKLNNDINNLEVLMESDHHKLHAKNIVRTGFYAKCKCCGISKYKTQSYLKKYKRNKITNYRCMDCRKFGATKRLGQIITG